MVHPLIALRFGNRFVKWFSTGDGGDPAYSLATAYLHGLTRAFGGFSGPDRVVLAGENRALPCLSPQERSTPRVNVSPSMAVRISLAAMSAGLSLRGVTFLLGAEPLTQTRKESIETSGARATVTYGFSEAGNVGQPVRSCYGG